MGMAASQVRLLQLTSRKNDIGFQLTQLSNEKVSLSRDMQKVAREYQNALNQKVLKWSNNSGVTYVDLSYQNLMRPSTMNQNTPYLLTDTTDRIVVDSEYQRYATLISSTGAPGGDWESVRTKVLSELTGIDADKIEQANAYQEKVWSSEANVNNLIENEPKVPTKKTNVKTFIGKLDSKVAASFTSGTSWSDAYGKGGDVNLGGEGTASTNLANLINNISTTLGAYLEEPEKFKSACDSFLSEQQGILQKADSEGFKESLKSEHTALSGDSSGYSIDVKLMLDSILEKYGSDTHVERGGYGNESMYTWNDIDDPNYQNKLSEHDQWKENYDNAKTEHNKSIQDRNQLFTADIEAEIDFYDAIFSSIAEKGWTYNNQVNDSEYLNQMLQNNMYTMTTVERDSEYDENTKEYSWDNDYTTDIASNFTNIFTVNDSDAREDALVEYENKKAIINEKESRIDTRMKNLETEQAAINQMIQGLEQVKNDNTERTMSWSA